MNYKYSEHQIVKFSNVDFKLKLGIVDACQITQNTVTDFFRKYDFDNSIIASRNNAVLVVLKHKLHFNRLPDFDEAMDALSYTTKKSTYLFEIETGFKHNDEDLFFCKSEICPVDIKTREVKKLSDIGYPEEMDLGPNRLIGRAKRNLTVFNEDDYIYSVRMLPTEIDYSGHVNNVCYIKYLINTFNTAYLKTIDITDIEISYIHEAFEGNILKVYRKLIDDNTYSFLIKREDEELTRATLSFKQK